ncbi:MAG: methylmalonyl-CoA mutase family protein [Myxococcota bacterium]
MKQRMWSEVLSGLSQASGEVWEKAASKLLKGRPLEDLSTTTAGGIVHHALHTERPAHMWSTEGFLGTNEGVPPSVKQDSDLAEEVSEQHTAGGWEPWCLYTPRHGQDLVAQVKDDWQRGVRGGWFCVDDGMLAQMRTLFAWSQRVGFAMFCDAGRASLMWMALRVAQAQEQGADVSDMRGYGIRDPFSLWGFEQDVPERAVLLEEGLSLAMWSARHAPQMRTWMVSTTRLHEAGAEPAQEIGHALAVGIALLRAMHERGLTLAQSAAQLSFGFALESDVFLQASKLRCFRGLWRAVCKQCGLPDVEIWLHAQPSARAWSACSPWENLLRGTASTFAAAVGGVEAMCVSPMDVHRRRVGALGHRLTHNTQTILCEEAGLARVSDPAAGSFYVESLTEQLRHKAWSWFQALECRDVFEAHRAWWPQQIQRAAEQRRAQHVAWETPIVGVNLYPVLDGAQRQEVDAALASASSSVMERNQSAFHGDRPAVDGEVLPVVDGDALSVVDAKTVSVAEPEVSPESVDTRVVSCFVTLVQELRSVDAARSENEEESEFSVFRKVHRRLGRAPVWGGVQLSSEIDVVHWEAARRLSQAYFVRTGRFPRAHVLLWGEASELRTHKTFVQRMLAASGMEVVSLTRDDSVEKVSWSQDVRLLVCCVGRTALSSELKPWLKGALDSDTRILWGGASRAWVEQTIEGLSVETALSGLWPEASTPWQTPEAAMLYPGETWQGILCEVLMKL